MMPIFNQWRQPATVYISNDDWGNDDLEKRAVTVSANFEWHENMLTWKDTHTTKKKEKKKLDRKKWRYFYAAH